MAGAVLRGIISASAVSWSASVGLMGVRVLATEPQVWVAPVFTLAVAAAITTTVAAVILRVIPPVVDAWHAGADYGARREQARLGVDDQRPRPRLVR